MDDVRQDECGHEVRWCEYREIPRCGVLIIVGDRVVVANRPGTPQPTNVIYTREPIVYLDFIESQIVPVSSVCAPIVSLNQYLSRT